MNKDWVRSSVPLKYYLGEIRLFKISFSLLVSTKSFLDWGTNLNAAPEIPDEALINNNQGALIRSYPISELLKPFVVADKTIRYIPRQYKRFYIDLNLSYDEYLNKFSSKSRSTLRRKIRKFEKQSNGKIDYREYKDENNIEEFIKYAHEVSSLTYQEKLLDAGLPRDPEFIAEIKKRAENAQMKGYLLFLEGKPISYLYCPIEENILIYQYLGYDPDYRTLSPGTVLQMLAIESLLSESKFRIFDFTEGEGQHKEFFSTSNVPCADIFYFQKTVKNYLIISMHHLLRLFTRIIAQILESLKIKTAIKRFIRAWK